MATSNEILKWENILPEDTPRIYIDNQWKTFEECQENIMHYKRFDSPFREELYILFTSQYLNITTKEKYDLFSIEVLVYDEMVILKDMHLLKLNVGKLALKQVSKYSLKNPYLKSKNQQSIYYLGVVNNYNQLTRNILQIIKGSSTLFTLGEDWLLEAPTKVTSATKKYSAEIL